MLFRSNSNIINKLESETGRLIDSDLKEFYKMLNGFSIDWSISNDQFDMNGSLHFFNIQQAFFGYKKINSENYESALEDVLWNEDGFEEKEIKKLKPHRVLESVAGDDAWYTYIPFTNNEKLYYICDGKIKTLKITRQAFINFRLLTMGLSVKIGRASCRERV